MKNARRIVPAVVVAGLVMSLVACSGSGAGTSTTSGGTGTAQSTLARSTSPNAPAADVSAVTQGETEFSFDLYRATNPGGDANNFFSPYSVSIAFSMLYAGAAGQTATEMASTFHYAIPDARLAPAFDQIDLALAARGANLQGTNGHPFRIDVSNSIWGQVGFRFLQGFLDTLAVDYGAGLRLEDFQVAPDTAVADINAWVNASTMGMIPTIFQPGSLPTTTRLVLANAVYFDAAWQKQFDKNQTTTGTFTTAGGAAVSAQFMNKGDDALYARRGGATAIELPYDGGQVAMIVIMPDAGTFATYEAALDATVFADIMSNLSLTNVALSFPKFQMNTSLDLGLTLAGMGMPSAFGPTADFSGVDGAYDLYIEKVLHEATAIVDEQGTQAAAVTAIAVGTGAIAGQPVAVNVDRAFIFVIVDLPTNAVLFVGRVANPM